MSGMELRWMEMEPRWMNVKMNVKLNVKMNVKINVKRQTRLKAQAGRHTTSIAIVCLFTRRQIQWCLWFD
jgi:hypothetical protein